MNCNEEMTILVILLQVFLLLIAHWPSTNFHPDQRPLDTPGQQIKRNKYYEVSDRRVEE